MPAEGPSGLNNALATRSEDRVQTPSLILQAQWRGERSRAAPARASQACNCRSRSPSQMWMRGSRDYSRRGYKAAADAALGRSSQALTDWIRKLQVTHCRAGARAACLPASASVRRQEIAKNWQRKAGAACWPAAGASARRCGSRGEFAQSATRRAAVLIASLPPASRLQEVSAGGRTRMRMSPRLGERRRASARHQPYPFTA